MQCRRLCTGGMLWLFAVIGQDAQAQGACSSFQDVSASMHMLAGMWTVQMGRRRRLHSWSKRPCHGQHRAQAGQEDKSIKSACICERKKSCSPVTTHISERVCSQNWCVCKVVRGWISRPLI
jgi:hypothetical protein